MKHFKTVQVPAKEATIVDYITCDFCSNKIEEDCYERNEVEIQYEHGDAYPEGGSGLREIVHMCGKCWSSTFRPWLDSQGVSPTVEKWEY